MKSSTFTKDFWVCLSIFIIIIGLICFFPSFLTKQGELDFRETGQIGDTIGGIMGPFVAIAAAMLTFFAFWIQYKANVQQREDIALERFENNLFQLIQGQEEITNNLSYKNSDGADHLFSVEIYGRQIFQVFYREKYFFDDKTYIGLSKVIEEKGIEYYEKVADIYIFDHYFRHLYRIFKYIDNSTIISDAQKYEYASIMRSSLSPYELTMLFYNCLSKYGKDKFKPIIEKYAIFNNLRIELLATEKELYSSKFKKGYIHLKDENRNMDLEYKKGAFIYYEY